MTMLIENPKANLLLDAGLDMLHQESLEWINMIAFWKDEIPYLQKLMRKVGPIEEDQLHQLEILSGLTKINDYIFDQLQGQIGEHEKMLSQLYQRAKGIADDYYRVTHNDIKRQVNLVEKELHLLKHLVFKFSKNR